MPPMKALDAAARFGLPDPPAGIHFTGITEDSRRVRPGFAFAAAAGEHADGHDFAAQAAAAGAVLIIGERTGLTEFEGLPYWSVPNARQTVGLLAHALAGDPTESMTVIGITGTNGKTSTALLLRAILEKAGHKTAVFGTLGYEWAGARHEARLTTPFGEDLATLFAEARAAGCTHAVMETSSHALDQDRVAGIAFDAAAFTNLTQDHLDYHPAMEDYLEAKLKLFRALPAEGGFGVVNRDDPVAQAFLNATPAKCYTYGQDAGKGIDCHAIAVKAGTRESVLDAHTPWGELTIRSRLLGRHNVANTLCAVALAGGLGIPLPVIAEGVASLAAVPGRFEQIEGGQPFTVVVDYAHTEDGLRNVLHAARAIVEGQLICVFGCGGDRDRGKRPKMGQAAAELADFAIVTSDNPRTEDPARIILDIEAGMQKSGKRKGDDYLAIVDRREAIHEGIARARAGDVVLIAGKGHEDYQILGTERIHFDDREVALDALKARGLA